MLKQALAVVSGGSRGVGKEISRELAKRGASVVVLSRSAEAAEAVARDLDGFGSTSSDASPPSHLGLECDVRDASSVDAAVANVVEALGCPTVLVNCAGITGGDSLLVRTQPNRLQDVIETNLLGPLLLSRAVSKAMLRQKIGAGGSIVNIGSVVGSDGNAGQAAYAASKAGLGGLTRSLARELGPRGIRVNLVEPGFIDAGMTSELPEARAEAVAAAVPLESRLGTAAEVASVVCFLASSDASYVTGQTLRVDGGLRVP